MPTRFEAEEHLRVIRSLMEKATIYRAICAEAAAVGGVLAIAGSFALGNWLPTRPADSYPTTPPSDWAFFVLWGVILFLAAGANMIFLYRAAARRSEPFVSSGMKVAITSLLPSFVVAGWLTAHIWTSIWMVFAAPIWITCYGLALVATKQFAPRSLIWLGWAFLFAGMWSFSIALGAAWGDFYAIPKGMKPLVWKSWHCIYVAQGLMAMTFGLFHLIYAACTWPRKSSASGSGDEP